MMEQAVFKKIRVGSVICTSSPESPEFLVIEKTPGFLRLFFVGFDGCPTYEWDSVDILRDDFYILKE